MTNPVKIELGKLKYLDRVGKYRHIHGYLNFEIGGRSVPMMGYRGINDVCFNQWIEVFVGLRKVVQTRQKDYIFDEGEQGQPAFLFKILPQSVISLSIVDSEISDGRRIKGWQDIRFNYTDFKSEFLQFKADFLATIDDLAPENTDFWKDIFDPK